MRIFIIFILQQIDLLLSQTYFFIIFYNFYCYYLHVHKLELLLLLLLLFTHSLMELSPSWKAANCATTRELLSILWNPEFHHRVHKSPPSAPILSQIDPIHTIPSYLSKIHFYIVHPSTSWSSQWSLSFWLSHQLLFFLNIYTLYKI
jgi:hypothetical protein